MRGGLTVTIFREKTKEAFEFELTKLAKLAPGQESPKVEAVADFSYTSDALAEMIVSAWLDPNFKRELLDRNNAKRLLEARGFFLNNPIIISEEDYNKHTQVAADQVVFVLPDERRVQMNKPGQNLLETAKLLMACVPNGI